MNRSDENALCDYWHRETKYVNDKVDEALKEAQNHAYDLGLNRGKEEMTDLAKRLVAARNAEDQKEWHALLSVIYRLGEATHNAGGEATGAALCDRSPRP